MTDGGGSLANGKLEIQTLDVEQADARLIITPNGGTILTDADKEAVVEELTEVLEERDFRRTNSGKICIDRFHVTHIDYDHVWGLKSLHESGYEVQHVVQPDTNRFEIIDPQIRDSEDGVTEKVIGNYNRHLERHGVGKGDITQVSVGDRLQTTSTTDIQVLAPPTDDDTVEVTRASTGADVSLPPIRPNENGAVYKLIDERSALFMGDVQDKSDHYAESWLIQQHDVSEIDLSADVLFVGHHGSCNATSAEFLERVEPKVAVVSSGLDRQYDHPHDGVLKNLHEYGVDVYWTASHGSVRTDLDDALTTAHTTALNTTTAADLAALKHYCREYDATPESVATLAPGDLPEETPDWVVDAAPMVAQTPEAIVDAAIANADSVEDLRQTLETTPTAHDHLREAVQSDRDEHVTTRADVRRNRETYFSIKRAERAYKHLPLHTRLRTKLPNRFGGIDHPLKDVPSSEEIDGPRDIEELPTAVKEPPASQLRKRGKVLTANKLSAVEEAADVAVETAETSEALCRSLCDTPGAHKDILYALDTPDAHDSEPERVPSREHTPQRDRTREQTTDRDFSLGL